MDRSEAKKILELYRPDALDETDPQLAQALRLAEQDLELGKWFQEHRAFQSALRQKFREIPTPPDLKDRILAQDKVIKPSLRWDQIALISAAAAVVLFIGIWFSIDTTPPTPAIHNHFSDYEGKMVRAALREYHMDLMTNDLRQVRSFMASHGAPANFSLPKGLSRLTVTGGGVLKWRSNPVTMVCFNRGDDQMLFLFIMDRSAVKDSPPPSPAVDRINRLQAVCWSEGDKSYVLAGPEEKDFLQKYL